VFGRQLRPEQVACRGITDIASGAEGLKHVATLEFSGPDVVARVQPERLPLHDPLARIDGTANAIVCRADPVGEVTVVGPGAGPELAGQGVLSDLIAVARWRHLRSWAP
jgi:homoserine dehydrogenase